MVYNDDDDDGDDEDGHNKSYGQQKVRKILAHFTLLLLTLLHTYGYATLIYNFFCNLPPESF